MKIRLENIVAALGVFLWANSYCFSAGILTFNGTLESITNTQFVFKNKAGTQLYYFDKKALSADQNKELSMASHRKITLEVPFAAVAAVKNIHLSKK